MAIMSECPTCHRKQAVRNKLCVCGTNLDQKKAAKKVRYHIVDRVNGKQKWFSLSSFEDVDPFNYDHAKDVEAKLRVSKRERKLEIFQPKKEATMTFRKLSEWYLELNSVKNRRYYPTLEFNLASFNEVFGNVVVCDIKPAALENYQAKRKAEGYSDSYVDQQIGAAKAVIGKAFDNDIVGGDTVKAFKKVKKLLKKGANRRDKVLSVGDFAQLKESASGISPALLMTAYWSGMRRGEIFNLEWNQVDLKEGVIRLKAEDTKSRRPRVIPIALELLNTFRGLPSRFGKGLVFPSPVKDKDGEERPFRDIREALKSACNGIPLSYGRKEENGFTFHDLRHTFNTDMDRAGVPQVVTMAIMGHEDTSMFGRYRTVTTEDLQDAIRRLEGYRAGLLDKMLDKNQNVQGQRCQEPQQKRLSTAETVKSLVV
ncbi:MAG: site-specific integrase [Desulfobacteraceae bacterium]|nr:MAG: site-specific integrase [Desulfobacteraceae bacterium]